MIFVQDFEEQVGIREPGRRIEVIPRRDNMEKRIPQLHIARCPLEIMVDLFYMGTWGNKVTKERADPQCHVEQVRLGFEVLENTGF